MKISSKMFFDGLVQGPCTYALIFPRFNLCNPPVAMLESIALPTFVSVWDNGLARTPPMGWCSWK